LHGPLTAVQFATREYAENAVGYAAMHVYGKLLSRVAGGQENKHIEMSYFIVTGSEQRHDSSPGCWLLRSVVKAGATGRKRMRFPTSHL